MRPIIYFVWQGFSGRYGVWKDGLWAAMNIIGKDYDVKYVEPWDNISNDGLVLYWEAPCTILGTNSANYKKIRSLPNKKALLFAGGRIEKEWLRGFDHVFYESRIDGDELKEMGISCSLAFGINEEIFKPKVLPKIYDGIHAGTCASWKRQWLVGEALGKNGLIVGRYQKEDRRPFDECRRLGCTVLEEKTPEVLADLVNQSYVCVQTSDLWGGGQRATLEAMACNVPVVCMTDSPKNREFVEGSLFGLVVKPEPHVIKDAVQSIKEMTTSNVGREYIMSKWTSIHYANALLSWISSIQ